MPQSKTRRIIRWLLLLAGVALALLFAGAIYYIGKAYDAKDSLAQFILTHPESSAVVAYTVDASGLPVDDGEALFYDADRPLILASTMKIAVLAAYADAVATGDLNPAEMVPISELERYYLPYTDGGAHAAGLASLGLPVGEQGFASDQSTNIPMNEIARIMIHYSGNAETDYLIARIGLERIESVLAMAGLESHSTIWPTLGIALAATNHETPSLDVSTLDAIESAASEGDASELDRLAGLYLENPSWRQSQIEYLARPPQDTQSTPEASWAYQSLTARLLPSATARHYASLMATLAAGRLFSADVSQIMQEMLESVPSDWPLRLLFFEKYGAKDGLAAGVLTIASYSTPKSGPFAGQSRAVVILLNRLPLGTWSRAVNFNGLYLLQTDLARGEGAFLPLFATANPR